MWLEMSVAEVKHVKACVSCVRLRYVGILLVVDKVIRSLYLKEDAFHLHVLFSLHQLFV